MQPTMNEEAQMSTGHYGDEYTQRAIARAQESLTGLLTQLRHLHEFGAESIAAPLTTRYQDLEGALVDLFAELRSVPDLRRELQETQRIARLARQAEFSRDKLDLQNNRLNREAHLLRLANFKAGHTLSSLWDQLKELVKDGKLPRGSTQKIFKEAERFAAEQVQRIADDQSVPDVPDAQVVDDAVDNGEDDDS